MRALIVLVVAAVLLLGFLLLPDSPPEVPEAPTAEEDAPAKVEPPEVAGVVEPVVTRESRYVVRTNVPGAEITLEFSEYWGDPDPRRIRAIADAQGVARFDPDPPAPHVIVFAKAYAEGYRPGHDRVKEGRARVILRPGQSVTGRVLNRAGEAVERAAVSLARAPVVYSDSAGRFTAWGQPGEASLDVGHAEYLTTRAEASVPSDGIEVRLERGLSVRGRIRFSDGTPAPGVRLIVHGQSTSAVSGPGGRFELSGLEPGRTEFHPSPALFERMNVEAGARDLDLVVTAHLVRIRFLDREPRPFPGLTVGTTRAGDGQLTHWGRSDAGGYFVTKAGPNARVTVTWAGRGVVPGHREIHLAERLGLHEEEVIVAPLTGAGAVDLGVVYDDGRPAKEAVLTLRDRIGLEHPEFRLRKLRLDEAGRVLLDHVPPGLWRLWIGTPENEFTRSHEADVNVPGGAPTPVNVSIPQGGRIRTRILDEAGKPRPAGYLYTFDSAGKIVLASFSRVKDVTGQEWLTTDRSLPPGRYRIDMRDAHGVTASREVDVRAGETTSLTLQVGRDLPPSGK